MYNKIFRLFVKMKNVLNCELYMYLKCMLYCLLIFFRWIPISWILWLKVNYYWNVFVNFLNAALYADFGKNTNPIYTKIMNCFSIHKKIGIYEYKWIQSIMIIHVLNMTWGLIEMVVRWYELLFNVCESRFKVCLNVSVLNDRCDLIENCNWTLH